MAIQLMPGQLERFIGVFQRTNAKRPPPRPDFNPEAPLDRLVITYGMLQLTLGESKVDVVIPEDQRLDFETYLTFTGLLTNELVNLLQIPHLTWQVNEAMQQHGVVAQFQGSTLVMNPLTASVGELDRF